MSNSKEMSSVMSEKDPELRDFGVTLEEYNLYIGKEPDFSVRSFLILLLGLAGIALLAAFVVTRDLALAIQWGVGTAFLGLFPPGGIATFVVLALIQFLLMRFKRSRLLASPVAPQIKLYEEAIAAYQVARDEAWRARRDAERVRREAERARQQAERERLRKRSEYWTSLSGVEFERELGILYERLGYSVESTPRTGDEGIDLIIRKDSKTTIVQCKRQNAPAGPAIARELFGSMTAFGADKAILACTGGFTRGVVDFARGKPIALISVSEIVEMAENANFGVDNDSKVQYKIERTPVCPVVGCGKKMVLRKGKYGEFWGCTSFPKCRGTINA